MQSVGPEHLYRAHHTSPGLQLSLKSLRGALKEVRRELRGLFRKQQSRAAAGVGTPPHSSLTVNTKRRDLKLPWAHSGFVRLMQCIPGKAGSYFLYTLSLLLSLSMGFWLV